MPLSRDSQHSTALWLGSGGSGQGSVCSNWSPATVDHRLPISFCQALLSHFLARDRSPGSHSLGYRATVANELCAKHYMRYRRPAMSEHLSRASRTYRLAGSNRTTGNNYSLLRLRSRLSGLSDASFGEFGCAFWASMPARACFTDSTIGEACSPMARVNVRP